MTIKRTINCMKILLDYWKIAEDSFDDSLGNHSFSSPKAVFNLAHNYK